MNYWNVIKSGFLQISSKIKMPKTMVRVITKKNSGNNFIYEVEWSNGSTNHQTLNIEFLNLVQKWEFEQYREAHGK